MHTLAATAAARDALERIRAEHGSDHARPVHLSNVRAKHAAMRAGHAHLTGGGSQVEIEIQAIRIGPTALLAAPMELFGELGLAISEASPFPWTAVSGYSNGSAGYLPTPEAHDQGGYEVETASPFTRDAASTFIQAAGQLVNRLVD